MSKVIIVPCDNYDDETIYSSLKTGIEELGGLETYLRKDEKILVKPNFIAVSENDRPITTHKSVIAGFLRILEENNYHNVLCGDSPAVSSSQAVMNSIGLSEKDFHGAVFAPMNEEVTAKYPDGTAAKEFPFAREVVEADAIIGLCKMKTHALMGITGAVKNMYGLFCGKRKGLGHVKFHDPSRFAKMLIDINKCVKPRFSIMDAVVAMEGNGPTSGDPVDMKLLLFSDDPVAMDTVFCYLVGIDPKRILTNVHGYRMGLGTCNENEIEIIEATNNSTCSLTRNELFTKYGKPDFVVDIDKKKMDISSALLQALKNLSRKPKIDSNMCIRCGKCVSACPVEGGAVHFVNGPENVPTHDYRKCIKCYCCQEVCPKKAIYVGKNLKK